MKNTIWVNTLVKNEERWIWYGLKSVLSFVDKIMVWDTGSTDRTVEIIKKIKSSKIDFEEKGSVTKKEYGNLRQQMLDKTKSDWVFVLDGDEIWPKPPLVQLIKEVKTTSERTDGFCVRPINFVGDIRFVHPDTFQGQTPHGPKGLKGFFSTRIFRRTIKGLHVQKEYGKESFRDYTGKTIRERVGRIKYLPKIYYWHMSYLPRSSSDKKDKQVMMRKRKRKFELGIKRPRWVEIPEVFYQKRPKITADPFYKMNLYEYFKALLQTPLKKIKRKATGWKDD